MQNCGVMLLDWSLEFNSRRGVAIPVAYWRRRSPGRKRGRPENGRPYEGWKMSKVQSPFTPAFLLISSFFAHLGPGSKLLAG